MNLIEKDATRITKVESNIDTIIDLIKELTTELNNVKDFYEHITELFVLNDIQAKANFHQVKDQCESFEPVIATMWNKLMTQYEEFKKVRIPMKYKKYVPPKTKNKRLNKLFKEKLPKMINFFINQEEKYNGSHDTSNKNGRIRRSQRNRKERQDKSHKEEK